ncbi:MAG TPA: glycosyltransferase family 1 protein [Terriglobales bacterium]|nr:glycosyltransferase family 1 protein [Terriglobales bacterium]
MAIDSWVLASRFRHQGTHVYARSLITEFRRMAAGRRDLSFCLFQSPGDSNDASRMAAGIGFQLSPQSGMRHDRWWRFRGAEQAAARVHADLLFAPTASLFAGGRVPVVCTIPDVTPVVMPTHSWKVTLLQRSLLRSLAQRARAIITISECSKRDLVDLYGVPESRVSVVYPGYDKSVFNCTQPDRLAHEALLRRLGLVRPYVLHHGTLQPRKNLKKLIEAYRLLLSRNRSLDVDLVLAGELGWRHQETVAAAAEPAGSRGRVLLPGALDDGDLALLVKGASLAVIPSLYEGFCLPMVEAMACGTPTIASQTSCLPEVSGNALQYFDPRSADDMAGCMEHALQSRELRAVLAQKGAARAQQFDWRRCAQQTLDVLERAAQEGR